MKVKMNAEHWDDPEQWETFHIAFKNGWLRKRWVPSHRSSESNAKNEMSRSSQDKDRQSVKSLGNVLSSHLKNFKTKTWRSAFAKII